VFSLRVVYLVVLTGLVLPASSEAADLSLTLDYAPGRVHVGSRLTYSLAVSNAGPDAATNVSVSLALPKKRVEVLAASTTLGQCVAGRTTLCELGSLEPAGAAAIRVAVSPTAPGSLTAVAAAAADVPDANPANDSAAAVIRVRLRKGACSNLALGTPVRDVLRGTQGGDALFGRAGDDAIDGAKGQDCLSGADGADRLNGGDGHDTLFGDAGADVIVGGGGSDLAKGGSGSDVIRDAEKVEAGSGNDRVTALPGAVVRCGPGHDSVFLPLGPITSSGCELTRLPVTRRGRFRFGGGRYSAGTIRDGGGGGRHRGRTCRRRRCPHGGIPASVGAPFSPGRHRDP
jgi:uncharacterized repeat protein (TIGR01451 family)